MTKIYRPPEPDTVDEWNDNWNPDKRQKPVLPDDPEEIIASPESVLHPLRSKELKPDRMAAKAILLERLAEENKTSYDEFVKLYRSMEDGAKVSDGVLDKKKINDIYKAAEKLVTLIYTEHRKILSYWPLQWMEDDRIIPGLLKRYRISDVMNSIDKYVRVHPVTDIEMYKGKYKYAAFLTDEEFYTEISQLLSISQPLLKKYVAALREVGALVLIEKRGQYSKPVYASGYYSDYPKYIRFMIQKNKEKLRKFVLV
ncbi:MAG: hypothetical protein Q7I89_05305 [Syntrophales bacterium]|nr:hypothetical protein [Syntrophales bacterium]